MSYRESVLRTAPPVREGTAGTRDLFNLGALGLAGESGEVVDLLKKHLFHGKDLDREKLLLELGDVRWYMEALCVAAGFTMDQVEAANVDKLRKRYPDGFTRSDSETRRDEVSVENSVRR